MSLTPQLELLMNFLMKTAQTDHSIHELLAARYSPYLFEPRAVEREKLLSCLEAARWAASSFNEQPWSFLLSERQDEARFSRMLACLMDANQGWAQHAGALLITVAADQFAYNNKPNRVCDHDIGLAVGNLTLQASSLGLQVHQMAGINLSKTRQEYDIPAGHHPLTAIAIGYAGSPESSTEEDLADRDRAPRQRKSLSQFVFQDKWNESAI